MTDSDILLDIRDLSVDYLTNQNNVRAVDRANLVLRRGETLGLAGESGCGKSTLAFSIARLHKPPALITEGQILFEGEDVLAFDEQRLRDFRWKESSIVFQSAMNCLNPVISIGEQICDVIIAHQQVAYEQAREQARVLLNRVGIHESRMDNYPHQFSGGMRQRAVIAIALALNPRLIILDEPTTALDVVVERSIMNELASLKQEFGFSILLISHDLSLMGEISDRIAVMYGGRIVEVSSAENILEHPQHPYTQGLVGSFPTLHGELTALSGIPGNPVNLYDPPSGCYFAARCQQAMDICRQQNPELAALDAGREVRCHLHTPG